jgi:putative transposase
MAKPYSIDLRERAVARVVAGESVRAVAAVLKISASSVVKWAQRERATGSVAPGQMGGHRPRVLVGDHRTWLLERAKSDFTLRGLVAELAERGVTVDYRTVWKFVHAERLSFKKKRYARRAGPA